VGTRNCRELVAQYRRDLEAKLQEKEVKQEMERVRATYPVFARYPSVEELATLMRQRSPDFYADKDAVLAALLTEIKRKTMLFPLLNLMFWDSLTSIFRRKRRHCPNPDDLFSRIQVEFFQVAATYPLDRRPRKIDVNLILDTKKKVTAWQREEAAYREQYQSLGPAHELGMVPADVQESAVFPEELEPYLEEMVLRQVINKMQYDLLLETEVYGRMTQKDWAEARGVKHATARNWHFRAKQAIQEYARAHRE